jgi:hypothetical protein
MDGVGAGTFGKPLLVELSHMIEQFALAVEREEARAQVHRLRTKLGLDPATTAGVDLVLDAVALSPQRALRRAAGAGRGHDHAGAPAAAGPATPPRRARPRGHARPELTGAPDCRAWPNAC